MMVKDKLSSSAVSKSYIIFKFRYNGKKEEFEGDLFFLVKCVEIGF